MAIPGEIIISELTNELIARTCDLAEFTEKMQGLLDWYGIFHPNAKNPKFENKDADWERGLAGFIRLSSLQYSVSKMGRT